MGHPAAVRGMIRTANKGTRRMDAAAGYVAAHTVSGTDPGASA
jgi:hypothetical protein